MISKLPYLQIGYRGTYYFRLVIPKHLRHSVGQDSIRRSLKTTDIHTAQRRAAILYTDLKKAMKKLLDTENGGIWSAAEDEHDKSLKQTIVVGNLKIAYPDGRVVECEKIETDPNSEKDSEHLKITLQQLGLDSQPGTLVERVEGVESQSKAVRPISSYIEKITNDKRREKCSEKYVGALRDAILTFIEIVGDIQADQLDRDCARKYADGFMKLPSNRTKKPQYRTKTVKQLLSMHIPKEDLVSDTTFNNNLQKLSTFAIWLKLEKVLIGENPFAGFALDLGKARYQWSAFTREEITKIFDPKTYRYDTKKPAHYWVPITTSHCGSRVEEICCMNKSDVIEVDGVWCLRLFEDADDKSSKNAMSERLVPIHSKLLELGFLQYVETLPNGSKLFPNLKKTVNGYHSAVSNAFNRYLGEIGVKRDKLSLKSFRHSVITELLKLEIRLEHIREIVGHSSEHDITLGRYAKGVPVDVLKRAIDQLDWSLPMAQRPKL